MEKQFHEITKEQSNRKGNLQYQRNQPEVKILAIFRSKMV